MVQIFVDTADADDIRRFAEAGTIDGVTTNPALLAKAARKAEQDDPWECAKDVCDAAGKTRPVSLEVVSVDAPTMIADGKRLNAIATNVVVKLPITPDGLKACRALSENTIRTNLTLCFSASQAILAAKAGATYVSPFVGRLDDNQKIGDGIKLLADIRAAFDADDSIKTQILAASIRTREHFEEAVKRGVDAVTLPPATLDDMIQHLLTTQGLRAFLDDWKKSGYGVGV